MASDDLLAGLDPRDAADPVDLARILRTRRETVARYAQAVRRMPYLEHPLAPWIDWDRCRVNVTHLVAPELVTWK